MERIGIRELNQQTSHYIAKVKAGETIEVTEHGQLVARLVPVQRQTSRLDQLIAEGKARPGSGEPLDLSWLRDAKPDGLNIADEIVKMREEERY